MIISYNIPTSEGIKWFKNAKANEVKELSEGQVIKTIEFLNKKEERLFVTNA